MKKKLLFFLVTILLFLWPTEVWAAKERPPRGNQKTTTVRRTYSPTRGVKTSVQFRPDRLGLLVNFADFGSAVSVTYSLTYTTNGILQGVRGTISPETAAEQREILFGTCSHGVCRYHYNITNARLVIDSRFSSGLIVRKPYRIKV